MSAIHDVCLVEGDIINFTDFVIVLRTLGDAIYVTRFARRGPIHAPLQYTDFTTTQ